VTKSRRHPRSTDKIADVLSRFEASFPPPGDEKRHFHGVYYRNTVAVKEDLEAGQFLDPACVEPWDVIFANLYLDVLDAWNRGELPSCPWQVAFQAANDPVTSPLVHVLIGLNAHLNYDLPQALLAVVTDEEFTDRALIGRRYRDFKHIDDIVVRRVKEEDLELQKVEEPGDRTFFDRLMTPLNRLASKRFLKEARYKVWRNAIELSKARRLGPEAYAARLRELEEVCRAKVADLTRPGKVLVRLGVEGYGVLLGPPTATGLGNPAGWPEEVLGAFDHFRTAEYATVTRVGTPVCHPLTPYVSEDGRSLAVSCGLTSPAKAERARRDRKVCLLYSNPTGSGLADPPVVLVYGTAAVRDRDLQRNTDRYIRWSLGKIPGPWRGIPMSWMRMLDWYWSRIWIEVTPERILWWPGGRLDEEPRTWEAPSGIARPGSDPPPTGRSPAAWRDGGPAWSVRALRVARDFPPPVVTVMDAHAWPVPFRATSCAVDGEGFVLRVPAGRPVHPSGPACVTFQRHDPDFRNYENAIFVGEVSVDGDDVRFAVELTLPDISLSGSWASRSRRFLSNARLLRGRVAVEAARRGQPPPAIRIPRYW
jgi:Family of unknown function (DUF5995)